MSIPLICGAVPSSLTVPVILPSPAAFTLWLRKNAPQETPITVNSAVVNWFGFVIENLSLQNYNVAFALRCHSDLYCWPAGALGSTGFRSSFFAISFALLGRDMSVRR